MRRFVLLPLVALVALATVGGAASGSSRSAHPYTVKQVLSAFASTGISLRSQHVPASAPYARFASSYPLRVIVFRTTPDSRWTIETDLGSRPAVRTACRRCVVIRLAAPRGSSKPAIQNTELSNLVVVYLKSKRVKSRVEPAMHELRQLHPAARS